MDEICLKENVNLNGNLLQGYIDYSTSIEGCDGLPKAKEALVIMLVALNSSWKVPIAYF